MCVCFDARTMLSAFRGRLFRSWLIMRRDVQTLSDYLHLHKKQRENWFPLRENRPGDSQKIYISSRLHFSPLWLAAADAAELHERLRAREGGNKKFCPHNASAWLHPPQIKKCPVWNLHRMDRMCNVCAACRLEIYIQTRQSEDVEAWWDVTVFPDIFHLRPAHIGSLSSSYPLILNNNQMCIISISKGVWKVS